MLKRWLFVIPVFALAMTMGCLLDVIMGKPVQWEANAAFGVFGILFGFSVLGLPPNPAR